MYIPTAFTWTLGEALGEISDVVSAHILIAWGHVGQVFAKLGLEPTNEDYRRVLAVLTFLKAE